MSDRKLMALGRHVREAQDRQLGATIPNEATRRHLAEYAARQPGQRAASRRPAWLARWSGGLLLPALALGAVVVAVLMLRGGLWTGPALTFSVGEADRPGVLRALESAPRGGHLPIRFSDGTRVNLDSNTRARVVAVGARGAEIVIESGRAEIDVVPVRDARSAQSPWRVSTGPFSIEVKGTRFDVAWNPESDEFALNLHEGSVIVRGCDGGAGRAIAAGQAVRASCARRDWSIFPISPNPAIGNGALGGQRHEATAPGALGKAVESSDAGVSAEPRTATVDSQRGEGGPSSLAEHDDPTWQELGRAGHYSRAFRRVSRGGFVAACERSSAADLMLLGDVARLSGNEKQARRAYTALRRRYPSDDAASRAAFALGRLDVEHEPRAAARWFDVYLREQPEGPLAQAALERLLELTDRLGDREWQREVARTYVRRYPSGPHAPDAIKLLERSESP